MNTKRALIGAATATYWLFRAAAWTAAVALSIALLIFIFFSTPGGVWWTR